MIFYFCAVKTKSVSCGIGEYWWGLYEEYRDFLRDTVETSKEVTGEKRRLAGQRLDCRRGRRS